MPSIQTTNRIIKPIVFVASLIPFAILICRTLEVRGLSLGPNPVEELLHELGLWALRFLLITLAITPLRDLIKKPWPLALRRMFGLYAFFYLALHFIVWFGVDLQFDWHHIGEDIAKRPFITIGFAALVLMIPLAITSTNGIMRRLGKRWTKLHQLVYVCAILGVWHFYWLVKKDIREPLMYVGALAILFAWRGWKKWRRNNLLAQPASQ